MKRRNRTSRSGRTPRAGGPAKRPGTRKCEIGHVFACNGSGIRHMSGVLPNDPKFYACMGCVAYLKRQGVRMKEVES